MAWKTVGAAMVAAVGLLGCSVHSQAPIRQVAYDFSDHAYYDRDFAPSPNYAEGQGQAWMAPTAYYGYETAGHAQSASRGEPTEAATQEREEPRRPARPHVDFDNDRAGSVATGHVEDRTPADPKVSDASRRAPRPRFTTSGPAAPSASEGRAEPASRPASARPELNRPERSRPAEAQSRRAAPASRPALTPVERRSMSTSNDDTRIAGR